MQLNKLTVGDAPPKDDYQKDLERALDKFSQELTTLLNKGLRFSDNFDSYIGQVTTDPTPGTETAIAHGLKRVPSGFLVIQKNKPAHVYNGASAWTVDNIYVRSDVLSVTATLMIF